MKEVFVFSSVKISASVNTAAMPAGKVGIMKKFQLARCPYCGKKLNPAMSWYMKTQGEYICPKCGGISNVALDPAVYILACAAILLSLAAFLITRAVNNIFSVSAFLYMTGPVFLFSLASAFLVRLKKPILRKKTKVSPGGNPSGAPGAPEVSGYTTQFTGIPGAAVPPVSQETVQFSPPDKEQNFPSPASPTEAGPSAPYPPYASYSGQPPVFPQGQPVQPGQPGQFPQVSYAPPSSPGSDPWSPAGNFPAGGGWPAPGGTDRSVTGENYTTRK